MNKIRKLICSIIGHNYICLHKEMWGNHGSKSTTSGWKCQRCEHQSIEQWDT